MSNWEKNGMLSGLEESDKIVVSTMLDKVKESLFDKTIKIDESIECEEKIENLLNIIKLCYIRSGITDVDWLIKDFQAWYIENESWIKSFREKLSNKEYISIDEKLELQRRYADEHGNRYMKQHGLGKIKPS